MINWLDANFLPWLLPVPPLVAFVLIILLVNRSWWLTVITALTATGLSWLMALGLLFRSIGLWGDPIGSAAFTSQGEWMVTGGTTFEMGVAIDGLTVAMLFMVPLAIAMIMTYSVGYMYNDPRRERFMAYMSLFAGAMLTLIVADNLLLLFIGWEVMGFCSYSLIGFWFEKESAYQAGVKAFMTTRVADVMMLLGIAYLYAATGTLNFRDIFFNEALMEQLADPAMAPVQFMGLSVAGLAGILLVFGTIGKSAQFPLHVWLPDAMEGPTPVSAMIHAAAMVSAGVYLVIRVFPLLEAGGDPHHGIYTPPLTLMAFVGAFTALFAAVIAVGQNDIKRVLAYSTISQLGYMVAALGIGAYIAAAFHLITHGVFKALLFMSSGAVIHAMEHGEHHVHEHHAHDDHGDEHHDEHHEPFDPQDMRNMGGLRKRIPVTWWAFLAGGMALGGFPLITAGFWSKDEILAEGYILGLVEGFPTALFVFIMLVIAAFLTMFYTMRQIGMTFIGEPRTEEAAHAGLSDPEHPSREGTIVSGFMQGALIPLAFFAVVAGFIGVHPDFPIFSTFFSPNGNIFFDFVSKTLPHPPPKVDFNLIPVLLSIGLALGGLYLGWRMYWRKPLTAGQEDPAKAALDNVSPVLWVALENRLYVDQVFEWAFVKPSKWVSEQTSNLLDRGIIDGILHAIANVAIFIGELFKRFNRVVIDGVGDGIPYGIGRFSQWFRRLQSGRIQEYLLMVAFAALAIGLFLFMILIRQG